MPNSSIHFNHGVFGDDKSLFASKNANFLKKIEKNKKILLQGSRLHDIIIMSYNTIRKNVPDGTGGKP